MRRTAIITAGSVVAALTIAAVLAVSGGAEAPTSSTIRLVTKDCTRKLIDVAPRMRGFSEGPGAGDGLAGSCPTFDRSGKRAGVFDYTCSFTKGGRRARVLCESVYALADGDLYTFARPDGEKEAGSGPGRGRHPGLRRRARNLQLRRAPGRQRAQRRAEGRHDHPAAMRSSQPERAHDAADYASGGS